MLKHIAFIACILFYTAANGQPYSYVYIQGDKQTPFYVKHEGEMLPRFGKNYFIISELNPGVMNIELLFQQNLYPPQKFAINVPENGFRGFLLTMKNGYFSLYDVHRKFYVQADNKPEDDNYLEHTAGVPSVPLDEINPVPAEIKEPLVTTPPVVKTPKPKPTPKPKAASAKPKASSKPVVAKTKPGTQPASGTDGPVFIDDVELRSDRSAGNTVPAGGVVKNKIAVVNSDCPRAIGNDEFRDIYKKAITRSSSGKLKYLLEKMDLCYTSNQVRQLATILPGDNERFTYLKRAFPRVTDQSAFERLENLLTSEEWKGYFRSMLQP
jgi:hypothetical protein